MLENLHTVHASDSIIEILFCALPVLQNNEHKMYEKPALDQ